MTHKLHEPHAKNPKEKAMKDQTIKIQEALKLHLDVSDTDARMRYSQLSESDRLEVARWADLLAAGLSVTVPGEAEPVRVDQAMTTQKIRAIWFEVENRIIPAEVDFHYSRANELMAQLRASAVADEEASRVA
jgi:hypothetical protein